MPTSVVPCPDCGAGATLQFGQAVVGCELHWWESFGCHTCGRRLEVDGRDDMPAEQRDAILREDGSWSIITDATPPVELLHAARQAFGLSLSEVAALKARLPGTLATGTRCEMEVALRRMRRAGGDAIDVRLAGCE